MLEPTILLVEDNPYDVLLLQRSARREALKAIVRTARDGDQAIAWLEGTGPYEDRLVYPLPALMVLDLYMPKRTGFDVLTWVRERPGLRRLPVVVLTTAGEGPDIARAYDLGANSCLVKPTSSSGMEEMLSLLAAYWLRLNRPAPLTA